jgi:transcriptional regulator of met regulon
MKFFPGLHQPSDAKNFERCFVSVNRLWNRRSDFEVNDWIMDSGAFTELEKHGDYRAERSVANYAAQIRRWKQCGNLLAAVAQDYMCEPFMLSKTGKSVQEHQRLTVERYDALLAEATGVYILPVLQGYEPQSYVEHLAMYGERLKPGAWVGVGSICKRNSNPAAIESVLMAIRGVRPDLRLHGFGVKLTALGEGYIRQSFETADSMAWSFAARRDGGGANDWRNAAAYEQRVKTQPVNLSLLMFT